MESVTSLKIKIKINNSYESEPSSGSGSSLSENNDGHASDEEHMNLPYLLKPYTNKLATTSPKSRISTRNDSPLDSSFEGFSDSCIDKQLCGYTNDWFKLNVPAHGTKAIRASPGQLIYPKFYDTIIEENSCNAVDLQLSNKIAKPQVEIQNRMEKYNSAEPSANLSFNGKIKSLTEIVEPNRNDNEVPATSNSYHQKQQHHHQLTAVQQTTIQNTSQLTESFILKKYNNERSPDLFADDDDDEDGPTALAANTTNVSMNDESKRHHDNTINRSLSFQTESSFVEEQTLDCSATQLDDDKLNHFRENCRRERELLLRIHKCLAGLPPPPSVTIPQLNMFDVICSRKTEILNFLTTPAGTTQTNENNKSTSLLKPTHTLSEAQAMGWRDILGVRQHGFTYNLNKASERNEYLSLSVIERFVGAETASSYRNSPSSAKKRNSRLKLLTQSPGNRLSHLAKRRAIFSSANLANTSLKSNSSMGPQLLIDKKKIRNKRKATPKRMTPGSKKKNRKTPTSSARKRLFRCDLIKPGPSRENSKRALFQSPAKQQQQQQHKSVPPKPLINPEIANRVEKSKRALFLTDNQSATTTSTNAFAIGGTSSTQLETLLKRKRNDADDEDAAELASQSSKLFRVNSDNFTPRALKIKSQSFCIGAGSSTKTATGAGTATTSTYMGRTNLGLSSSQMFTSSQTTLFNNKMQRAHSDMAAPVNSLTENQRKKLLWAVSQALQEKKINAQHESFKQYASVLARAVKRIFQEFYQKSSTSNSETMLRLSKKYVYNVVSGKNADDIYYQAKAQICDARRQSTNRLSGYIGPEEYQQRKLTLSQSQTQLQKQQHKLGGSIQNIFNVDTSNDSFGLSQFSQTSTSFCGTAPSQLSTLELVSQDILQHSQNSNSNSKSASKQQQLSIQPNSALHNSSSKSNLGGLALRENVDCEQRRSAQKNFTGKDQRNVSPYTVKTASATRNAPGSGRKSQLISEHCGSGTKAKRQISFDS